MERVKSVPARPRWRWRERAHAAMRSTIGGGAALSLRYFWCFCYFAAPGLYAYTSQGPGLQGFRMRTERCGRCVGCGIRRSCRRPISRPITFYNIIPNSLSYSKFPHQQINILFYCGGGSGYRQPCRTPCARARCTVTVLAQLISDTWVPSWAPLLWPRARRHRSPHNRMPRVPNVRHLHFPLSPTPLDPNCFKRLGPAPRTAAPRGRAPSATRMWSAGRPDGPAARRHAFAHCQGLKGHNMFPPPSSLESASVSVAAVTSTVAYAGAGCT